MTSSNSIQLRLAREDDAAAILSLYEPYVRTTHVTFEVEVPSLAVFTERIANILHTYPYVVAECNGELVGYAYAHRFGERAAYAWNTELSVYVAMDERGRGTGQRLCEALIGLLQLQGVRNVFSRIVSPNVPSVKLHEKLGFRELGMQQSSGFKLGNWHDVTWHQKMIGSFEGTPEAVVPLPQVDAQAIAEVLARYSG